MATKHTRCTLESSSLDHPTLAADQQHPPEIKLQYEHLYSMPEQFPVPESGYDHHDMAQVLLARAVDILDVTIDHHQDAIEAQYAARAMIMQASTVLAHYTTQNIAARKAEEVKS